MLFKPLNESAWSDKKIDMGREKRRIFYVTSRLSISTPQKREIFQYVIHVLCFHKKNKREGSGLTPTSDETLIAQIEKKQKLY